MENNISSDRNNSHHPNPSSTSSRGGRGRGGGRGRRYGSSSNNSISRGGGRGRGRNPSPSQANNEIIQTSFSSSSTAAAATKEVDSGSGGGKTLQLLEKTITTLCEQQQQQQSDLSQTQDRRRIRGGEKGRGRGRGRSERQQQQQKLPDNIEKREHDTDHPKRRNNKNNNNSRGGRGKGGKASETSAPSKVDRPQDDDDDDDEEEKVFQSSTTTTVTSAADAPSSTAIATTTTSSSEQENNAYYFSSLLGNGIHSLEVDRHDVPSSSSSSTITTSSFTGHHQHLFHHNNTNVLSGGGGVLPSHPPIFMSRLNTHLSLDNITDDDEEAVVQATIKHSEEEDHDDDEDHIARQLATGLLLEDMNNNKVHGLVYDDDNDDDDDLHQQDLYYGDGKMSKDANKKGGLNVDTKTTRNRIVPTDVDDLNATISSNPTPIASNIIASSNNPNHPDGEGNKRVQQLVKLPAGYSLDEGGNVLPIDESKKKGVKKISANKNNTAAKKKKVKEKSTAAARGGDEFAQTDPLISASTTATATTVEAETPALSASEAIANLTVKEVSIGESTTVQIKSASVVRRISSKTSISNDDSTSANTAAVTPIINLLAGSNHGSSTIKITGAEETNKKSKKAKGSSSSSSSSKKHTANKDKRGSIDETANNLRAARQFNRLVRSCVERSDPDGMRTILRDKHNHKFALDAHVLETVMKAYIMAAMFEDALYCLRNCTLPGTLSTLQTEQILLCLPQNLRNSSAYTAADMIDALCIATKFDVPTKRTYFMRIVRGISLEFLQEATSARDRICSAPCERLVRSAHCVVDARLRRGRKPSDLIVDPGYQLGVFIPDTQENRGMQTGDAVSILPYAGPYPMSAESLDRNMIEATVTNAMPLVLRLQDKGNMELYQMLIDTSDGNVYRIDKLANRMGYTRQLSAVISVVSPIEYDEAGCCAMSDRRRPSTELIKAITAMDENIDQVMMAGGNFHPPGGSRSLTSTATICSQAISWRDSSDTDSMRDATDDGYNQEALRTESLLALEKYGALEGLNASQRLAVQGAASNRLTLVQGPPGTGKTAVAIRILQHWARLAEARVKPGENPMPILATSDSNIAVDNLVEGCANVGLRVVRLGRPEAIRPELLQYCIDRPTDKGSSAGSTANFGGISASMFKEKMKILKRAQVVCCTCIGSGGDILDSMTFERVMVDEATQATEPAVLVPLTRGCRQLVLVGDHCQLPPTVLSTRAEEEGLGVPLFSRMVACGVPPFMLDTQYRMHPAISMFPSDLFYGGKLNDGVSPPERRPLQGFPWPREEFPVAFVPVVGNVEIDDGVSKANEEEAIEVCHAVVQLLNGGQCTVSDIAVVTPYSGQVRLIRRKLRSVLPQGPPFVEVSSTDGFQGREKEAVIFSAVRSNSYGTVGFVSDWRRINVSFTRARRALIVVGNPDTLRRGDPDTFGAWLQWADAHGVNMMSPGKPRGRYEPEVLRKVRGGTTAAEMLKDVLDRQQAQLKTAEQQQARALVNAAGHIIGKEADTGNGVQDNNPRNLKDDLALLENSEGCWDDSDDDADGIVHSSSYVSMASSGITKEKEATDGPLDTWDL